ncbi:MAG: ROK family protein, partial [Deltaproteobacteria bacterium]|nr:ROK family protein [Deltaproteobacteria bacterium]
GHILLPTLPLADGTPDPFEGVCPFHGRCLEGLVSGPAIAARTGRPGEDLADDDPVWDLVGRYLGAVLAPAVLLLSPVRIVVGGSVSGRPGLLPRVRRSLAEALGGYLDCDAVGAGIDEYVVPPGLGSGAGIAGSLLLAQSALGFAPSPVDGPPAV